MHAVQPRLVHPARCPAEFGEQVAVAADGPVIAAGRVPYRRRPDIHGVLPVLDAVLALPEVRAADRIVVCGDHAAGPQPTEVLDRLTSLDNVVLVRGNADRDLVAMACGEYLGDEEAYPVDAWAAG